MGTLALVLAQLAVLFHTGAAVPLVWIIGLLLIIAGVITLFRGGLVVGIVLVILGVVLGGLQVL